jgi:hypothetical protein
MDVDGPFVDFGREPPDAVEQLSPQEDAARLFQKIFEQAEFGRPEMDVARAAAATLRLTVEVEIAGRKFLRDALGPAAAEQRADPRRKRSVSDEGT